MRVRSDGEHELGGVLLGVGSQLMDFDFRETFVNAFEVELHQPPYIASEKLFCRHF